MAIKAILEIYNSKRDVNGNCYFAFCWHDDVTADYVYATSTGGASNLDLIPRYMGLEHHEVYVVRKELGIREFDKFVKEFPHAGSQPEEMASFIKKEISLA